MKKIYLNKDHRAYALVDDDDYEVLSKYKWMLNHYGYAYRQKNHRKTGGKCESFMMHHEVIGKAPKGMKVDHINRDTLDNRRSNLRVVTISENRINTKVKKNSKIGVKNVQKRDKPRPYMVNITRNHIRNHIGSFYTIREAIEARDMFLTGVS